MADVIKLRPKKSDSELEMEALVVSMEEEEGLDWDTLSEVKDGKVQLS